MALDASLTIDKYLGSLPMTVHFTGIALSGVPTTWLWNFGDGIDSSEQNPSHTYTSIGTYTVRLTVSDGTDNVNLIYERAITVLRIDFDAYPKQGKVNLKSKFYDISKLPNSLEVLGRQWDFGDGTALSPIESPVHTYVDPGAYTVSLTVAVRRT